MKKLYIAALAAAMTAGAYAQTPVADANRVILTSTTGETSAFMISRIQDMTFARVDGEVAADIEIFGYDLDFISLSVTRTPACQGFKIGVIPSLLLNRVSSEAEAIRYLDYYGSSEIYYQDFSEAELTGIELDPDTDYTVMTYGVDIYGVPCGVRSEEFHTDRLPVVGSPYVDMNVDSVEKYSFTLTFTPNSDVTSYYFVAGEAGTMQDQYEFFGPMFGFSNFGQMIMAWGVETKGAYTYTYSNMSPNTDYEVFVQPLDKNGNLADVIVYNVKTSALGGEGDAYVDITLGDYRLNEWYDDKGDPVMLPSQFMTFTPNDQCSCYRFGVYLAENYDADPEGVDAYICSEPPMPYMSNWFFFDPLTTDYQIDPGTDMVALAAGKNVNGAWGEINRVRFSTPGDALGAPKASKGVISKRFIEKEMKASLCTPGRIPTAKARRQQLINK